MKKFKTRTDKIKFLNQLEKGAANILELAETTHEVWWKEDENTYHNKPFPESEYERLSEEFRKRIVISAVEFQKRAKENPHIQFIIVTYGEQKDNHIDNQ